MDVLTFQSVVWNVIKSTRDCLKANDAALKNKCNGDTPKEHNIPFSTLENAEWMFANLSDSDSKNNLGEIHKSHGLDWAFHSLSHYFLLLKHNIFFWSGGIVYI